MPAITPDSKVSVALLTGILGVSITATAGGAVWVAQVNARLRSIEEALKESNSLAWTHADMILWTERLRHANPTLVIPVPEHYK